MATCQICSSSRRVEVEASIAQGRSIREVAAQFAFSRGQVHRHSIHAQVRNSLDDGNIDSGLTTYDRKSVSAWTGIFRKAQRKSDIAGMSRAQQAIDEFYRLRQTAIRKEQRQEMRLKIVFDDPSGKSESVDAWENLSFTISHYGALPVLEMAVEMIHGDNRSNHEIKQACFGLCPLTRAYSI